MVIQPPVPQHGTRRPPNASPPVFEKLPSGGRFVEGGDAHFECRVRANPPPEVVWSRRGMPIRNDHRRQVSYDPLTGNCSLFIRGLTADDDGDYTCTAVNCAGEASLTASIQRGVTDHSLTQQQQQYQSFQQLQQLQQQTQQQTQYQTQQTQQTQQRTQTQHSYQTQQHAQTQYHTTQQQQLQQTQQVQQQQKTQQVQQQQSWKNVSQKKSHVERRIDTSIQRTISSDYEGDPGSPLYFSGVEEGFRVDTFEYRLLREIEFRDAVTRRQKGEPEPTPVTSIVAPPSAPQILQTPRNSKLLEGSEVTFQARIQGNPNPRITWFRNGQRLVESQRYKMSYANNLATLHIHMALPEDAAYYTLLAENDSGRVACSAHLVIEALGSTSDTRYTSLHRMDSTGSHRVDLSSAAQRTQQVVDNDVDSGSANRTLTPKFVKVPSDKDVTEGKMVRFDCRVTGRPFPDVLWFRNGVQVVDDSAHKLLVNEGGVHSLLINATRREDAGNYVCIAKNKSGESRFEVNLVVIEKEQVVAPKFVERFQTLHVRDGEPATLHVRAVGTPVPRITWQKDGVQIHSNPPNVIIETHEGSSTIYFNTVTANDSAWYQCTAQNQAGSTATRARLFVDSDKRPLSEPWRLYLPKAQTVIEPQRSPPRETIWLRHVERTAPHIPLEEDQRPTQKPAFTTHLMDLHVQEGERAHFDARLIPIGDATMNVEWFVNGKPVITGSRVMTTCRFGYVALTLLHVYPEDCGVYTCRAINEAGEATTTATLKCSVRVAVDKAPQHPESMEAIQHLEDWERFKRQESVDESMSMQKPNFIRPLSNLENVQEGGFAHFEAQITPVNDPLMKIEWFFNGQHLTAGSRISTTYSFGYVALNIATVRAEDSGVYMCKAINQKGEAFSTATLKVRVTSQIITDLGFPEQQRHIQKTQELETYQLHHSLRKETDVETVTTDVPSFRTQLRDQSGVQEGRTAHFEARLEPTGDSTMRIEWLKDGRTLEASSRTTTFFNFGYVSLTIRSVDSRDTGVYTCLAKNVVGSAQSSAKLTCISLKNIYLETQHPEGLERIQHLEDHTRYQRDVHEEKSITQRPSFTEPLQGKEQLLEGQSAHFETRLEPMGDHNMTVEWFFNGRPLTTGHRFKTYFDFGYVALDILYVFPEDSGTFTITAKNNYGSASLTKTVHVQAKSSVDTSTIHDVSMQQISYLERGHQEPNYFIDEVSKCKPYFTVPLKDPRPLREGESIHLECRIEPLSDPTMKVEWFFNGKPLPTGSRYRTYFEFGYVALDLLTAYPEDSGEYTVRASNHLGSSHTSSCIKVFGKSSVITETLHQEGLEKIQHLEDHSRYRRNVEEETSITQIPTFTKPLHNLEVLEGSNIHLECRLVPVGDESMHVDWFVNGQAIKVGHRFRPAHEFDYVALDILSIYPEDSGVYTCKARNKLGESVSSCSVKCKAKSQILLESHHPEGLEKIQHLEDHSRYRRDTQVEEAVKIQPRFLSKLTNVTLKEGQTAHFECRLEPVSDPTLRVEWFYNNKALPAGHRYRPFHDFGYVALNVLSVVPEDGGTYKCRASNALGATEVTATLQCQGKASIITDTENFEALEKIQRLESYKRTGRSYEEEAITQAPVFTHPPKNVEIKEGERVHFECRLIPVGDPNLKVEWFCNGQPVKTGSRFIETVSFGFVALDILYAYPEDQGTYTCKASNSLGEAAVSCQLKCSSRSGIIMESAQPDCLPKIQRLEEAERYGRLEYQEETTNQAPVFTQPMKNITRLENQTAHFECRLIPVGDPKLKVEWFHNGMPLMQANRIMMTHDFGFVALDLTYVKAIDTGTYSCKAINELGQALCSATLDVKVSGTLLLDTMNQEGLEKIQYLEDTGRYKRDEIQDVQVTSGPVFVVPLRGPAQLAEGQSCHMECKIDPYPDPTMKVEWFHNGKPLQTGHRFKTMYDFGFSALDVLTIYPEDSGEFMVKATNQLGTATSVLHIRISGKSGLILEPQQPDSIPKIRELESMGGFQRPEYQDVVFDQRPNFVRPIHNIDNLVEGQQAHLEATLTPVNDPTMKVEWFHNGRPIPQGHRFKLTYDFGFVALDILYAFPEHSGTYMCKATNKMGEAVTTASIKVEGRSGVQTDTLHQESLERIRILEDTYVAPAEDAPLKLCRPVFTSPLKGIDNMKEGQPAHLECKLEPINDPKLKVEWFHNGIEIKPAHRFKTTHDFGYVAMDILYTFPEDTGTYMCKATNELGEAVTTCSIQVQSRRSIYYDTQHPEGLEKIRELESTNKYQTIEIEDKPICPPIFTSELRGTTSLVEGQACHMEARVEPTHDPELKIEFFHNGRPLGTGTRMHMTFDFGYLALDIAHMNAEDSGLYTAKATNKLGQATSSINITVTAKKSIILDTHHPDGLEKIRALEDEGRFVKDDFQEPKTFQRPVFTVPLQNLDTLNENEGAHMECRLIPVGDPTLKVEWFFNERPLQTSSRFQTAHDFGYVALDIQYVRPDDVGVYMCRASNELGEAVTTAAIRIKSKAALQLETQHPEGLEKIRQLEDDKARPKPEEPEKVYERPVFTMPLTGPRELTEGQPAHFEARVVPVGDPNLKLEWYINGVELKTGSRIRVTHDFGFVSLDMASTIPEDSGLYMCKAVNRAGEAVTTTAINVRGRSGVLGESQHPETHKKTQKFEFDSNRIPEKWVDAAPQIPPFFTQQLTNFDRLVEGQSVHIEAKLEPSSDEKLRVEWYKNGKTLILGTRVRTTFDFGLVTLDIAGVRPDDSGIYTCRGVNQVGEATSTCTLKVEGRENVLRSSQHPDSLPKIQQLEAYQYPHDEAPEEVFEGPFFITHLNNLELMEGDLARLACQVEPAKDPTLTIEFTLNGKALSSGTRITINNDFGFITLDFSHVITEDAGIYTCKAKNSRGQAVTTGSMKVTQKGQAGVISSTIHPTGKAGLERIEELEAYIQDRNQPPSDEPEAVFPKPFFVVPLVANFTINEGEGLRLECQVEPASDPLLTIEWFFNGKALSFGTRFKFLNDFGQVVLDVTDLWPRDCGIYTCRAKNKHGEAFTTTTIEVISKGTVLEGTLHPEGQKGLERIQDLEDSLLRGPAEPLGDEEGHPPVFTSQFTNLTNLTEGDIAHFEATLTPAGDQTMVVEWFFKKQPLKAEYRIRTVHAFGMVVLEILGVVPADTGEYTCRATNRWGRAEITLTLESVDRSTGQKPRFTTQLQSLVGVKEGISAHFECNLIPVGDPKMRVEWFHNGKVLRESSRIKTLSDFGYVVMDISFLHAEDSGEYVCVATNLYGSDTTRCTIQCTGFGKVFRDSLQPQSLERIAELEGSHMQYRSQVSLDSANQPPRFETQIQNLADLVEGQSAHFEARLTPVNDPQLTVEWFFNGKPLRTGHRFRTFHDFGIVILDILYCYGEDSGEYVCKATNRLGTDVTRAKITCKSKSSLILDPQLPAEMAGGNERIMQLEDNLRRSRSGILVDQKKEAPRFTVPLENLPSLREGENAHFEAKLTPVDDPDLKVDWFKNGKPLRAGTRIRTIHDFGFVVLEISPVYPEDSGVYSCRATNVVGEAVTSCSMKCEGKRSVILDTQLPVGMEDSMAKIARFEEVSDTKISEQWMDVDFSQPPKFLTQPQDLSLQENALAHFECKLVPIGDPTMKVEWFHNGKSLVTGSRVKTISDFGFVILEVAGVYPRDNGVYTCKATNKNGEATVSARLNVKGRQSVVMDPQLPKEWRTGTESLQRLEEALYRTEEVILDEDKNQPPKFITQVEDLPNKTEGDAAHFECKLIPVGDPTMRVEWYHNGKPLVTGTRVHTVDDFGFVVLEVDWLFPRDAGEYLCRATNKWGYDTTKAVLKVKAKRDVIMDSQLPQGMSADKLRGLDYPPTHETPMEESPNMPPKFITQIQPLENLVEGDSAHFECRLQPVNDPKLRVEWYHDGKPLRSGHRYKTTHDFGFVALDVLYVYPEDSGEYTARAVNELGEDSTKATIKCKGKPSLEYRTQLPKEMEGGVKKIAEMEASWQRAEDEDDVPQERCAPIFVMKPEPQVVTEGEWAKFCCRVTGYPRPKLMWVLNGNTVITGSRYKLTYDGIFHLDIPKSRQYDQGKVEVFARNALGEAYCWTTLEVRPKYDDYRAVLKNSPRPWYDTEVKSYQKYRFDTELQRRFDEKLTPGGTKVDIWKTKEDEEGEHHLTKKRLEEEDIEKLRPEVQHFKTDSFYIDPETGKKVMVEESQSKYMARIYEENLESKGIPFSPTSPESQIHGREVHVSTQKQTQKEIKGDLEIQRKTTVTETMEQEHKGHTKERKVIGPAVESKPPVFTKKAQPCRVYEGEHALFECKFTGTPAPNITWYRESFPITSSQDFQITTTDTTSKLQIKEVYLEDSGVFSVKAENRGGSAKSSANLVVEERREQKSGVVPPSFTRTVQDTKVKIGQLVRLDARVTGSKPLDVYWLKNGKKVLPDITHKTLEENDQHTLLMLEAGNDDAGTYECVAINQAGEARCQAQVTIDAPSVKGKPGPAAGKSPQDSQQAPTLLEPLRDTVVKEGQPALFKCRIQGTPAPQVKWFQNDNLVKQSRYFRMTVEKDTYTLKISEAFPEDEGAYKCVASNPAGTVTTTANLKVLVPDVNEVPPSLSPLADLTVPQGSPARFVTSVTGNPTPKITWYKEGNIIKSSRDFQMAQDGGSCSLAIRKTYPEDEGVYTCRATNGNGQAETSARLTIESKH